jgi:hypothetical protein
VTVGGRQPHLSFQSEPLVAQAVQRQRTCLCCLAWTRLWRDLPQISSAGPRCLRTWSGRTAAVRDHRCLYRSRGPLRSASATRRDPPPGSSARLDSGIRGACLGWQADGGLAGPARPRLPWLVGLVDDLVSPVRILRGRTLRVRVAAGFCPAHGAGRPVPPGGFTARARVAPGLLFWCSGRPDEAGVDC